MRKRALLPALIAIISSTLLSATLFAAPKSKPYNHPVVFEPNMDQVASEAAWIASGRGYEMFIAGDSATFALFEAAATDGGRADASTASSRVPSDVQMTAVRMRLNGSRAWKSYGLEPTGGVSNYFVGNDPRQWVAPAVCTVPVCTARHNFQTDIYTAGFRWVPGSNVSDAMNVDGFAVKVVDSAVIVSTPVQATIF